MDAFTEIGVFVAVVETRSFTRAGQRVGMTASGVSRVISRLEDRLGLRLLNRTTRSLSLTDDGAAYHARCVRIVAELEEANLAMARARTTPSGRLKVDAPGVLAEFVLSRALPRFLEAFPDVGVDLTVRDQLIDPVAEGVDVVLRMAELKVSDLVAKRLGSARLVIAGAPSYFARHGRPREPSQLASHQCLGFLKDGSPFPWSLRQDGEVLAFPVRGKLHASCPSTLRAAAVEGVGLIQVFEPHVAGDVAQGALELVLTDHEPEPRSIFALYARDKYAVPKVRVFIDFLAELFQGNRVAKAPPRRAARG